MSTQLPPGFVPIGNLPPGFVPIKRPAATPEPSWFDRALSFSGRLGDRAVGAGLDLAATGIRMSLPVSLPMLPERGLSGRSTAPLRDAIESIPGKLEAKAQRITSGESTYGRELAQEIPRDELPGPLAHVGGLARAEAEFVGDIARDPLTYGALGALKKLGIAGKGLTAGASAIFAIQAGRAVPEQFRAAHEAYKEDGGWTPRVTEAVAKGVLLGGAAALGGRGAIHETVGTIAAAAPKAGGRAYVADPKATPAQIAEAQAAHSQSVGNIDQAGKRLLFERSAALERQPGARVPAPTVGTPEAAAFEQATRAAHEQLATGDGPRAPIVERSATGEPRLTPKQAKLVQRRLLQLWAEEGGPARPVEASATVGAGGQGTAFQRFTRRVLRTAEPAFEAMERIPGPGQEIAGRLRAKVDTHERGAGKFEAESMRALNEIGIRTPEQAAKSPLVTTIAKYLDGQIPLDEVPLEARPVAQKLYDLRVVDQRARAQRAGIDLGDEAAWPHRPIDEAKFSEDAKAKQMVEHGSAKTYEDALQVMRGKNLLGVETRSGRKAGSERARQAGAGALQPGEYRMDFGAWFEAAREMEGRIAEAQHLGKNGEKIQPLLDRIPGSDKFGKGSDRYFAQTLVDRIREVEPQGAAHAVSSAVRSYQSAVGLVAAPLRQVTTIANTATEGTIGATVKSVMDTFGRQVKGPDGQPISWGKPIRRMRAALNDARLDAQQKGALYAGTAENFIDAMNKTRTKENQGGNTGFSRLVAKLPTLKATGHQDTLQRVIASGAAKRVVPEAWKAAKAGDASAVRQLERWGVDPKAETLTPEMLDRAQKVFSDRSQYKVGIGELPLWASSPWGKVAFQFTSFGYAHARFVGHALAEAGKGNVAPISKLLVIGSALGYADQQLIHLIFQGKAPENPTEKDFAEAAAETFQRGKHFDPSSPKGLALAAIEGLGAYGGVGALGTLVERGGGGDVAKILFGATGADLSSLAKLGKAVKDGEGAGDAAINAAAGLAPNLPLGLSPREWAREATTDTPIANPGYAGRIKDAVQGKEGATVLGAIPIVSQAAEALGGPERTVSKERADQGELDVDNEKARVAREEREGMLSPAKAKPIDKRKLDARKRALRESLMLELVRAVKRNDMRAIEEIKKRALSAGIDLYGRSARSVEGRVIMDEAESEVAP